MSVEVQAPPSYRHAVPSSTATQDDGEPQETEWKPCPGSTGLGGDHPPAAPAAELHTNPKAERTTSETTKARLPPHLDRGGVRDGGEDMTRTYHGFAGRSGAFRGRATADPLEEIPLGRLIAFG
jgi:hypothetical protein